MIWYLHIKHYDAITDAVKIICNLKEDYTFQSPSTALKVGQYLQELCELKFQIGSKAGNNEEMEEASRLKNHIQARWRIDI